MNLLAELQRRNVFRVAGLYLVAAWLAVQVAETLLPTFGAPGWVLKSLVVLLALGFVPAVVFAWVFEITPDGVKRERANERRERGADRAARRLDIAVIVLLLVAIGMIAFHARRDGRTPPETQSRADASDGAAAAASSAAPRSIAVLAFANLSTDKDQEYFADGISEELLNLLARIDGLKVAARTSSFKFKGTVADIGEIGRALGVETVLEGSVRRAGDQVRITAQLIKVDDGFHLWSQSYDRRLENILAVQDEIAGAIVDQLRLKLDLRRENPGRTESVAAYDLYLRARQLARAPTRDGLLQAIELFEQALALDPDYAAAHAGVAEAWVWLEDYGGYTGEIAFPRAERAATRALALDPDSPEANTAMAFVQRRYYDDPAKARASYERTLAANPNYAVGYVLYGDTLRDLGEPRRMIEVHRRAVELDPLSAFYRSRLANRLMINGRVDEARAVLAPLLDEHPDDTYVREQNGDQLMQAGRFADAAAEYVFVHRARTGDPYSASNLAQIGLRVGNAAMAEAWIAAARARGADNRWELGARESLANSRGDWRLLAEVGKLQRGRVGAATRATAAIAEEDWRGAREHVAEGLELAGYRPGEPIALRLATLLTLRAWLDRRDGITPARDEAQALRAYLVRLADEGGLVFQNIGTDHWLARLAAASGDRDEALARLRKSVDSGFSEQWFLQRDPLFGDYREDAEFLAIADAMRERNAGEHARILAAGLQVPP